MKLILPKSDVPNLRKEFTHNNILNYYEANKHKNYVCLLTDERYAELKREGNFEKRAVINLLDHLVEQYYANLTK